MGTIYRCIKISYSNPSNRNTENQYTLKDIEITNDNERYLKTFSESELKRLMSTGEIQVTNLKLDGMSNLKVVKACEKSDIIYNNMILKDITVDELIDSAIKILNTFEYTNGDRLERNRKVPSIIKWINECRSANLSFLLDAVNKIVELDNIDRQSKGLLRNHYIVNNTEIKIVTEEEEKPASRVEAVNHNKTVNSSPVTEPQPQPKPEPQSEWRRKFRDALFNTISYPGENQPSMAQEADISTEQPITVEVGDQLHLKPGQKVLLRPGQKILMRPDGTGIVTENNPSNDNKPEKEVTLQRGQYINVGPGECVNIRPDFTESEPIKTNQEPQYSYFKSSIADDDYHRYTKAIVVSKSVIDNEKITDKLDDIYSIVFRMYKLDEANGFKSRKFKRELDKYIPSIVDLIYKYRQYNSTMMCQIFDNKEGELVKTVLEGLGYTEKALENVLIEHMKYIQMDIESDIDALKTVLSMDGLINDMPIDF